MNEPAEGVVTIVRDPSDAIAAAAPVAWAVEQLGDALANAGAGVRAAERLQQPHAEREAGSGEAPRRTILVAGPDSGAARDALAAAGVTLPGAPEALAVVPAGDTLLATGAGVRGLVYAVLDLADRVRHAGSVAEALQVDRPVVEQPATAIRSIARLFTSVVEDKAWWYDRAFWRSYLTELATHRFNRFSLTLGLGYNFPRGVTDAYLHFSYPFLLDVPGYQVRVTGLPDEERERNLATLQFIGEEVRRRGLHFQLGLWTHAYAWVDSPCANYYVEGLTPANHAVYCRDALRLLLERVPAVDGLTLRVHGESGIPEGSYDFWRTVFEGAVAASRDRGRPLEIDMHAKGVDQETIDVARSTGLPIQISAKYWAEHQGLPYHQAAIREIERAAPRREGHMAVSGGVRRHSRYGYTDLLREDRPYGVFFRIWPGTQRLLLWGDPDLAAGFGRQAGFAGCQGVELCEPLTFKGRMGSGVPGGRHGYADAALAPEGGPSADWEKYRYTYRVWGRCTYDPHTDPDGWERWLRHAFGAAAADAGAALANASRILLLITTAHSPSANCKILWPEIYTNMPIVSDAGHPYSDTASPKRFGTAGPLDPALFAGVDEFAAELVAGERSGKYSPLDVARWLEGFATAAERHLAAARQRIGAHGGSEFRRWDADVSIQAALGHFFARKLRAGVGYALSTRTGDPAVLRDALGEYHTARAAWAQAADHGRVYRDDLTFGPEPWQRGHWADRLPAIDADIADLERALAAAQAPGKQPQASDPSGYRVWRAALEERPGRPVAVEHAPPASFRPGTPVPLTLRVTDGDAGRVSAQVRYRHVNQAEGYAHAEMERDGDAFHATIPARYADSPYALEYFFVLRRQGQGTAQGVTGKSDRGDKLEIAQAWLYPGFDALLANQPYFLVRQDRGR